MVCRDGVWDRGDRVWVAEIGFELRRWCLGCGDEDWVTEMGVEEEEDLSLLTPADWLAQLQDSSLTEKPKKKKKKKAV